ncbi:type II secretion system protein [Pseudaquabacterium rugosum]|uniref:Type II secretion system protein n=1 Tax=Pseudaquabacterium rugosum TaxID=2984194 RepID=A0ABU9BFM3_9BURK
MMPRRQGFTMIEMIVVIVILGVLAAVAMPRFLDVGTNARSAAMQGVVGAAASAMTVNYAGCSLTGHLTGTQCRQISNCNQIGTLLVGGLPTGYTPTALPIDGSDATVANGDEDDCTITGPDSVTGTFKGIAAGN